MLTPVTTPSIDSDRHNQPQPAVLIQMTTPTHKQPTANSSADSNGHLQRNSQPQTAVLTQMATYTETTNRKQQC